MSESWLRGEEMKTVGCCAGGGTERLMDVVVIVALGTLMEKLKGKR